MVVVIVVVVVAAAAAAAAVVVVVLVVVVAAAAALIVMVVEVIGFNVTGYNDFHFASPMTKNRALLNSVLVVAVLW